MPTNRFSILSPSPGSIDIVTAHLFFNFHNFVQVIIATDNQFAHDFFKGEYGYHQTESSKENLPTIFLHFQDISKNADSLKPTYTNHSHKIFARWKYNLTIMPDSIEIDAVGNRMSIPMIHHMLLHQSLRYLCSNQSILMLHAGAVANQGRSLIFSGQGGVGKTTTTSLVLAAGGKDWLLHADDYVFLAPGPVSYCYTTRSHLYQGLLRWVPEAANSLSPAERNRLRIFGGLRKLSGDKIKMPVRVPPTRLWQGREIQAAAIPIALILLKKEQLASQAQMNRLSGHVLPVDDLLEMNFYEARHFITLVKKNRADADSAAWLAEWQIRERRLLSEFFHSMNLFQLSLPGRSSNPAISRNAIFAEVQGILEGTDARHNG